MTGVRPSTSLPGSIAATTASGSICVGQRQLDEDPVDVVVLAERGDQLEQLLLGASPRRGRGGRERIPTSSQALCLLRDVDLRGGVLADEHRRQRRRPARLLARSSATSARDPLADLGGDRLAVDHPRPLIRAHRFRIGA